MRLKKVSSKLLLGISLMPGPWESFPVPGPTPAELQLPKSKYESIWLESNENLGSYIHKLKAPISISKADQIDDFFVNISWMIKTFPQSKPSFPLDKANDDYAVRIGFIFARKGDEIKMPDQMAETIHTKLNEPIARVVHYAAVPEDLWNGLSSQGKTCGRSPYEVRFMTCLKPGNDKDTKFKVLPFLDLKAEFNLTPAETMEHHLVAIWLLYDSDNTKSKSSARLNQLEIMWPLTKSAKPAR